MIREVEAAGQLRRNKSDITRWKQNLTQYTRDKDLQNKTGNATQSQADVTGWVEQTDETKKSGTQKGTKLK